MWFPWESSQRVQHLLRDRSDGDHKGKEKNPRFDRSGSKSTEGSMGASKKPHQAKLHEEHYPTFKSKQCHWMRVSHIVYCWIMGENRSEVEYWIDIGWIIYISFRIDGKLGVMLHHSESDILRQMQEIRDMQRHLCNSLSGGGLWFELNSIPTAETSKNSIMERWLCTRGNDFQWLIARIPFGMPFLKSHGAKHRKQRRTFAPIQLSGPIGPTASGILWKGSSQSGISLTFSDSSKIAPISVVRSENGNQSSIWKPNATAQNFVPHVWRIQQEKCNFGRHIIGCLDWYWTSRSIHSHTVRALLKSRPRRDDIWRIWSGSEFSSAWTK